MELEFLMKKTLTLTFLQLLISSCAGTPTHLKMLKDSGSVRVENVLNEEYNYKVFIKNTTDFGWDGGLRSDREKAINLTFKDICEKTDILDEVSIQTGTYAFAKPALTWIMKIKCIKKAGIQ